MKIKLAICCPVFNCLAYTREFVKSIHSDHPFDLVFHDNGSTDGTEKWLVDPNNFEPIPNLEMVHVLRSDTNLGVAKGANSALRKAYSLPDITHIIYSNNDILLRRETIDNLVWVWENKPLPELMLISGEGFHRETFGTVEEAMAAFRKHRIKPIKLRFGACYCLFIWDKKAIDSIGYLDEEYELGYFDDNDHAETILEKGLLLAHFSGAPFFHYGSVTIKLNSIDNGVSFNKNRERFFEKHNIKDREIDSSARYPEAIKKIEGVNEIWKKNMPEIVQLA